MVQVEITQTQGILDAFPRNYTLKLGFACRAHFRLWSLLQLTPGLGSSPANPLHGDKVWRIFPISFTTADPHELREYPPAY